GVVQAADAVQQRGLAGAVGADDRVDVALGDGERHVVEGLDAAEPQRDVIDLEHRSTGRQVRPPEGVLVGPGEHWVTSELVRPHRQLPGVTVAFHYLKGKDYHRNCYPIVSRDLRIVDNERPSEEVRA